MTADKHLPKHLRKIWVRLSMATHTSIDYFKSLTLDELEEVVTEIQEVNRSIGERNH